MDKEMGNIIEFGNIDKLTISGTKVTNRKCRHSKLQLDELRRLIECKDCGQFIEPYDYVFMFAKRDVDFRTDAKNLGYVIDGLNAEVERLKAEKSRLQRNIRDLNKRMVK